MGSEGWSNGGSSSRTSAGGGRGCSAVRRRTSAAVGGRDAYETGAGVSFAVPLSIPYEMSITERESCPTMSKISQEYGPMSGFGPPPVGTFCGKSSTA